VSRRLNIERLHTFSPEHRSGKTVRMLVEAAQNADFLEPGERAVILAHNIYYAEQLASNFAWVARELGFEKIERPTALRVDVNGRMFVFGSTQTADRWLRGMDPDMPIFTDHFALE
jgi:hypothetical protein